MIGPGATIGILGGGQLGRMLAMAGAQMGYRCHVFAPEPETECVAADVAHHFTQGDYRDADALDQLARDCAVVTYEFENVPVDALATIKAHCRLRPGIRALEFAQSRNVEKGFVQSLGGATAPFAMAEEESELSAACDAVGYPAILKTNRMGYDGKGQARLASRADLAGAWETIGGQPAIAEGFVRFDREFSILLVRGANGDIRFWPACENVHRNGILDITTLPAHPEVLAQEQTAQALAARIAAALDYVGVLACEFFATQDGPVFNEMAPRVHNSGHWTIEGAITSQFENHIRAICDLPLGDTGLAAAGVRMTNLIGEQALDIPGLFADPCNHVHLYGKAEARPGRKMGHTTKLAF